MSSFSCPPSALSLPRQGQFPGFAGMGVPSVPWALSLPKGSAGMGVPLMLWALSLPRQGQYPDSGLCWNGCHTLSCFLDSCPCPKALSKLCWDGCPIDALSLPKGSVPALWDGCHIRGHPELCPVNPKALTPCLHHSHPSSECSDLTPKCRVHLRAQPAPA